MTEHIQWWLYDHTHLIDRCMSGVAMFGLLMDYIALNITDYFKEPTE